MLRLGYACQNLTLPATTTHTLRLAGVPNETRLREVVNRNLDNLERILRWNAGKGIALFRIGSHLVPFASHSAFPYDWRAAHGGRLREIGQLARGFGQRLSMHPGQYTNPGSPSEATAQRSLEELRYAADVLDLLDAPDGVLVLHMGGGHGDKPAAAKRFISMLRSQSKILRYLALENDERIWTPPEVFETAAALGVPAILDTLHQRMNPGGMPLRQALAIALATWTNRPPPTPTGTRRKTAPAWRPKLHISSQDADKHPGAHSRRIRRADWAELLKALDGRDADIMIEAKDKDLAALTLLRTIKREIPLR
jgi:UV DNA damage endonuclease